MRSPISFQLFGSVCNNSGDYLTSTRRKRSRSGTRGRSRSLSSDRVALKGPGPGAKERPWPGAGNNIGIRILFFPVLLLGILNLFPQMLRVTIYTAKNFLSQRLNIQVDCICVRETHI